MARTKGSKNKPKAGVLGASSIINIKNKPYVRVWPNQQFGKIADLDTYITKHHHRTANPAKRWEVSGTFFSNLTNARNYVETKVLKLTPGMALARQVMVAKSKLSTTQATKKPATSVTIVKNTPSKAFAKGLIAANIQINGAVVTTNVTLKQLTGILNNLK